MTPPDSIFGRLGNRMFQGAYLIAQMRKGEIPDIYVQDYNLWKDYADEIRALYGNNPYLKDYRVALHVRRGDYLKTTGFYTDLCQSDYYARALEEFPNRSFLVFCHDGQDPEQDAQDMAWCRATFTGPKFDFWKAQGEIKDLNKMASCDGIIMANSTFSWWAAFLGEGNVVAPEKWFANGTRIPYPPTWTIL